MRIVTVGTSMITDVFIKAIKAVDGVVLAGVHSRTRESAKAFAAKHGAEKYFTSLEEVVADEAVDCVYIASPNGLHFEQAILCLEHGKHVICEKPIFSNIAEWNRAHEVAAENDVYLIEAMRNVHMPNYHILKEKLPEAGKINSAVLSYAAYSSRYDRVLAGEEPNIFSLEHSGGALTDLGVYPLSVAVGLFGKPEAAQYFPVKIATGVDGGGTLILTYEDFVCTILISKIATSFNPSEIQGEKGTFIIDDIGGILKLQFADLKADRTELLGEEVGGFSLQAELEAFYKIIKKKDHAQYEALKALSCTVLEITEEVRKANGIIYPADL